MVYVANTQPYEIFGCTKPNGWHANANILQCWEVIIQLGRITWDQSLKLNDLTKCTYLQVNKITKSTIFFTSSVIVDQIKRLPTIIDISINLVIYLMSVTPPSWNSVQFMIIILIATEEGGTIKDVNTTMPIIIQLYLRKDPMWSSTIDNCVCYKHNSSS